MSAMRGRGDRAKGLSREEERRSPEEEDFEEVMREAGRSKQKIILNIPEPVDDLLRNFLRKAGLSRTLSSFEAEWYSPGQKVLAETLRTTASTASGVFFIPDALTHRQLLQTELEVVHREKEQLRREVLAAGESLVRMQRERDFHRLQYRRVAEEKNGLMEDFKQLKRHLEAYEPVLRQLEDKHQAALRQKMLISLQKDWIQKATEEEVRQEVKKQGRTGNDSPAKSSTDIHLKDSQSPVCSRLLSPHPAQVTPHTKKSPSSFSLSCSIRAHWLPIGCIHLHPQKLILASASDDCSWRLWALPAGAVKVGEMVLSGEGHSDWLSGCTFHPDGSILATTSGDKTVRLWDSSHGGCLLTLSGHSQPTWGCSFHSCGNFLASCSTDRTAKLWDLNSQRCYRTLRCHTASVNSVCFLSSSNLLLTCSADRSLALWDTRVGVCTTTFKVHRHPCNHATVSPASDSIVASCDSRGIVNLLDLRKPASSMATVDAGPQGANQVAFNQSGKMLAVACDGGSVRLVEVESCAGSSLEGHSDSVQSVTFDHKGGMLMSAGSEGIVNIWS